MPSNTIGIAGQITQLSETDAQRLAAFVLLCDKVLATAPLQANGTFRVNVPRAAVAAKSTYAITLAVAPASAGKQLNQLPNVPKVTLKRAELEKAEGEFRAPEISISSDMLAIWWDWCRWFCINGTVNGPNGCAAPGAMVTVYHVTYTGSGYSKTPLATVTTAANGTFTACFEWCHCVICPELCWPCGPIWWRCWPWWWEWDILRVIQAIESQRVIAGSGPVQAIHGAGTLIRPEASSLVRGQGFGIPPSASFSPDAQRTQLIASKLANPQIREAFPWWWWCCDNPNILFSVIQNGNLIVNESPATSTRWCFEEGTSVSLVGGSETDTVCNPQCPPESGFAWTNVGDLVEVSDINNGYADPAGFAGTDSWDMPFAGELFLYGQFADSSDVAYYQVLAAQWAGNPARGGTQPPTGSGTPIVEPLQHAVYLYNSDGTFNSTATVVMGPFSQGGVSNLYATPAARQNGPTPPGLAPFPAIPANGFVFWDHQGLIAHTFGSSNLIAGAAAGAVDLSVVGYDSGLNVVLSPGGTEPDDPLTLMIDNTGLTTAQINSISAFTADGTLVTNSTSNSNSPCPAYDIGPGGYVQVSITVNDTNGHLFEYQLVANYGSSQSVVITPDPNPSAAPSFRGTRGYETNPLVTPAPAGVCNHGDPDYTCKGWQGGTEVVTWSPPVDCCYEFLLRVGKRVTNGDSFPSMWDDGFQTLTLKVSS